jgi:transposase
MRPEEGVELEELLAANHDPFAVYVLRDALKDLWRYRHPAHAARAWRGWYRKALRCRIEPLRRFARNLRPYLPGILAHGRCRLGTNLIEGINNKIRVIKRIGVRLPRRRPLLPQDPARLPGVGR